MTNGSLSKGMATNNEPVFRLAGRAKACTPPSIVSVCDMAVMSSIGGLGGASAIAFVSRCRVDGVWRSCSLGTTDQAEHNDRQPILLQRFVGSTQEILTPTARHQEPATHLFFGRDESRVLAACKALASKLYASLRAAAETGCKSVSLGHNELGRARVGALAGPADASYRRKPGPRRTPS